MVEQKARSKDRHTNAPTDSHTESATVKYLGLPDSHPGDTGEHSWTGIKGCCTVRNSHAQKRTLESRDSLAVGAYLRKAALCHCSLAPQWMLIF